jgi:hypothetical protein
MSAAPASPNGSSPWAQRYAADLKRVITEHAARAPRTVQQHLGPSELGHPCDRSVAGKMAALPPTNHVSDPWPSIMGTAGHLWVAEAFEGDNLRQGTLRWITEQKVTPHPDHPGTADLYDADQRAVVDWKFLGKTTLPKIRNGWPIHYKVQLLLYGYGYHLLGLPVDRVALVALPRTEASLTNMYVLEHPFAVDGVILPEVMALLEKTFADTARRRAYADQIVRNEIGLMDVPAEPSDDNCWFCPSFRPEAARDGGVGCPGPRPVTYG